jgi:predicted alpha/beta hydrolase family esterase
MDIENVLEFVKHKRGLKIISPFSMSQTDPGNEFEFKNKFILIGHSLGSAPTVHIASKVYSSSNSAYNNIIRSLILISPIASGIKFFEEDKKDNIGLEKTDVFCNIKKINEVKVPVFLIHGIRDEIIPVEHSLEMLKYMKTKLEWLPKGGDHVNILTKYRTKFFQKCILFLDNLICFERKNSFNEENFPLNINNNISYNNNKNNVLSRSGNENKSYYENNNNNRNIHSNKNKKSANIFFHSFDLHNKGNFANNNNNINIIDFNDDYVKSANYENNFDLYFDKDDNNNINNTINTINNNNFYQNKNNNKNNISNNNNIKDLDTDIDIDIEFDYGNGNGICNGIDNDNNNINNNLYKSLIKNININKDNNLISVTKNLNIENEINYNNNDNEKYKNENENDEYENLRQKNEYINLYKNETHKGSNDTLRYFGFNESKHFRDSYANELSIYSEYNNNENSEYENPFKCK